MYVHYIKTFFEEKIMSLLPKIRYVLGREFGLIGNLCLDHSSNFPIVFIIIKNKF